MRLNDAYRTDREPDRWEAGAVKDVDGTYVCGPEGEPVTWRGDKVSQSEFFRRLEEEAAQKREAVRRQRRAEKERRRAEEERRRAEEERRRELALYSADIGPFDELVDSLFQGLPEVSITRGLLKSSGFLGALSLVFLPLGLLIGDDPSVLLLPLLALFFLGAALPFYLLERTCVFLWERFVD